MEPFSPPPRTLHIYVVERFTAYSYIMLHEQDESITQLLVNKLKSFRVQRSCSMNKSMRPIEILKNNLVQPMQSALWRDI